MAGKIRLLTDEVIGKIAAGEVVERPSSAIKEMVENSLDAGATAVTVEIRDGGISYFRVTDNGSGISQSEIRMAFERHATSKITKAQDLFAIQTLGFRGEALASIAAVARVTCTTRTRQDASGIKVVNCGGKVESIEEAACPEGTTFVVRDLFFNTPVRLKFLKKPVTEAAYVSDLMMHLILSRPDVSFRYISQGKTLYHSAGDGKMESAVFSIYGKEVRKMQAVKGHQGGILLSGYVGTGDSARASRAHESFYINGRYMRSGVLSSALESACRERVPQGRFPSCVLHLTMPFDMVDVNVHPNKLECRFQNDAAVAEAIEAIIRDAYQEQSPLEHPQVLRLAPDAAIQTTPVSVTKQVNVVPAVKGDVPQIRVAPQVKVMQPTASVQREASRPVQTAPATKPSAPTATDNLVPKPAQPQMKPLQPTAYKPSVMREPTKSPQQVLQTYLEEVPMADPVKETVQPRQTASFLPEAVKPIKLLGSAFNSYIVAEYGDSLLLIDQQGVHERLLFDRMLKALDTRNCSQELLIPMIVPATRREQQLLENHQELLRSIGLNVEPFGETEVAIRAIPMILGQPQAGDLLRDVLEQLEGERGVITLEKRRAGILALACKKAVRSGEQLTEDDLRDLVVRMVEKHVTPTSPRGTLLIVALTHSDIDRRFRRSQ